MSLSKKEVQLQLAEQQLYGYHCAKCGDTLTSLVNGMGLTYDEWVILRSREEVSYLNESQVEEIDLYLRRRDLWRRDLWQFQK